MLDHLSLRALTVETRYQAEGTQEDTTTQADPHQDIIKCMLMRIKKKSKNSNGDNSSSLCYSSRDKWLNKIAMRTLI